MIKNNDVMLPTVDFDYSRATLQINNFEEVKTKANEYVKKYENWVIVNPEEEISLAKKEIASLRKIKKTIDQERISIKKEILSAVEPGENQIKEIVSIIDRAINNIDEQIKNFENDEKNKKYNTIKSFFEDYKNDSNNIVDNNITFEHLFKDEWLNKSYKLENIQEEIITKITQINNDLVVLSKVITDFKDFSRAKIDYFENDFNLSIAISKYEKAQKEINDKPIIKEVLNKVSDNEYQVVFGVLATENQLYKIVSFLKENDIHFKQINNLEEYKLITKKNK